MRLDTVAHAGALAIASRVGGAAGNIESTPMRVANVHVGTLLTLAIAVPNFSQAQSFQGLGFLPGQTGSQATAISANGLVVVGCSIAGSTCFTGGPIADPPGSQAVRWSGGVISGLGFLPGGTTSVAYSVNADGSVIVGCGGTTGGCGNAQIPGNQAFRWTQATGMIGIGFLPGGTFSRALQVNGDGSVVVGDGNFTGSGLVTQAFRWTQATGMVGLGFLPGDVFSSAEAVSADGLVVAGYSAANSSSNSHAWRWTQATGLVALSPLPGFPEGVPKAVNPDGSVIVGYAYNQSTGGHQAFRWTQATGMVGLGYIPGGNASLGWAVSADGSVVVGQSNSGSGGDQASRWIASTGMQSVKDLLQAAGVNMGTWSLARATGVSANGQVIVGYGQNPSGQTEAWIASLPTGGGPGPGPGPGFITLSNVFQSFASLQGTVESGHGTLNANLGTLAEIAQHHECKTFCINAYGLYSAERGPSFDDPGYLGTVGVVKALARDVSAGLTVGIGSQRDDLASGSSDKQRTVSGGVHLAYIPDQGPQAIGGAIISRISATIDRGYLNGVTPVTSTGDTKGTGVGGIVRLGWAARLSEKVRVIPFGDYEITRVRYSAYTETTGPFPAVINAIDDTQQRTRLGMEARYWFTPLSYVWGTAAWGHRITGTTAPINGTLIGLFDLAVPGSVVNRDWTETTAGLRYAFNDKAIWTTSIGARFGGGNSTVTAVRTGLSVRF